MVDSQAPFLQTKRLILQPTKLSDLDDLIKLRSDREVMCYIGDGKVQTAEQVKRFVDMAIAYQQKYGFGFCSVFEKRSGDFVGQAGLFHLSFYDKQPEIEIAYRLHQRFWRQGYATELASALIDWGFRHLEVERLVALIDPENSYSCRVLEKVGMSYTGQVNHYDKMVPCYEIYRNEAVELLPYNDQWPLMASKEIDQLKHLLPTADIVDIQHVGSTAIIGMCAKPVIDIQIAVESLPAVKSRFIDILCQQDYIYWDKNPDPKHLFFTKGMPPFGVKRTHNLHIFEYNSSHWLDRILFRDYLTQHSTVASAYEKLKFSLAEQYRYNREQYTDAKKAFVQQILLKIASK